MIRIEHTPAQGTLVHGTVRGDGAAEILRIVHSHFRWNRNEGAFLLLHSRNRQAKTFIIEQAKNALENVGFTVEVSIDDSVRRDVADIEADRAASAEARVERHNDLAGEAEQRWTSRDEHNRQIREGIPLGQPLNNAPFVRRLQKSDDIVARDIDNQRHHEQRAGSAWTTQRNREDPRVTIRRIQRLQADLRKLERERPAYSHSPDRYYTRRADLSDQIAYWKAKLAGQETSGSWHPWKPEHFRKGDEVECRGRLHPVVRVNPKSVTVEVWIDGRKMSWTNRISYDKITGRHRDGDTLATPPEPRATSASRSEDLVDTEEIGSVEHGQDQSGSQPGLSGP